MNRIIVALVVSLIALVLLMATSYAHATLPQDAVIIVLKTAKVT